MIPVIAFEVPEPVKTLPSTYGYKAFCNDCNNFASIVGSCIINCFDNKILPAIRLGETERLTVTASASLAVPFSLAPAKVHPGGAILPLYDELKNHKKIKHILVRHEQGAGHAAEGYARSSGKPGVVLVTSGPGATNMVTALTDAYMDSIPLVCVTGQVPTHLIGTDAFQECDTTGITRPCTKHNWLVKNIKDLPIIMHKAFHIATSGRPGPVLVDIPKDIQFQKTEYVKKEDVIQKN